MKIRYFRGIGRYASWMTGLFVGVASMQGCSSVESARVDREHSVNGLTYFLPRRDVILSVTVPDKPDDPSSHWLVNATTSSAIPDLGEAFVATIPRSQIAKVTASIQVSSQGLLNSESSGSTTSSLTSILQSIAGLKGSLSVSSFLPPVEEKCSPGEHTKLVQIDAHNQKLLVDEPMENPVGTPKVDPRTTLCGFKFELVKRDLTPPGGTALPDAGKSAPGLFYRIDLPYVVRATRIDGAGDSSKDFLLFSPTGSPTYFLPIARAGFGSNSMSLAFADGVPTKYGQTIDSEFAGVVQLPATLASAYFEAIGKMFTQRKTPLTNEKDYIDALNSLAVAEQRRTDCAAAVELGDPAKIKEACKN